MGSDYAMHPPTWDQLTPTEKARMRGSKPQTSPDEALAQKAFKKWYADNVAQRDNPDNILQAWTVFWAGYKAHISDDLEKHR